MKTKFREDQPLVQINEKMEIEEKVTMTRQIATTIEGASKIVKATLMMTMVKIIAREISYFKNQKQARQERLLLKLHRTITHCDELTIIARGLVSIEEQMAAALNATLSNRDEGAMLLVYAYRLYCGCRATLDSIWNTYTESLRNEFMIGDQRERETWDEFFKSCTRTQQTCLTMADMIRGTIPKTIRNMRGDASRQAQACLEIARIRSDINSLSNLLMEMEKEIGS